MNIDIFKQMLIKETISSFSWQEDEDVEPDECVLYVETRIRPYDDGVSIRVNATTKGFLDVSFTFDEMEINEDTLKLINYFNNNSPILHAYVAEGRKDYLRLTYVNPECPSAEYAISQVLLVLRVIKSDNIARYLLPLTVITK